MGSRLGLALLIAIGFGATAPLACAADASADPVPVFATLPPPATLAPGQGALAPAADPHVADSIYHGLYVGTEVFGIAGHGIEGGVGGDVYGGYERRLDNGAIVGMQGSTGYGPAIFGGSHLKGFEFGEADARVAYPMGRFTPFIEAGLVVAKPVTGAGIATNTTDSFNDLLNGSGSLYAAPRVGAGVAYQITGNTSVAVGVSVGRGLGGFGAFP